jgi:hypothetical protein
LDKNTLLQTMHQCIFNYANSMPNKIRYELRNKLIACEFNRHANPLRNKTFFPFLRIYS